MTVNSMCVNFVMQLVGCFRICRFYARYKIILL